MSIPHRTEVEAPDRLTLSYIEQGDRGGIPLILLHGLTDSMRSYEPILAELPDRFHAFALSQRGHGDSGKPPAGYGASDFAADVDAFMDAVGIQQAVIVGHSMGAWVASRFAVAYPERTLGLVLAGALATFRDRPDLDELLESFEALSDPVDPAFIRGFQESTLAQPVPDAFLDTIIAESGKVPARIWAAALGAMIAAPPEAFHAIEAPTLLAWGERDEIALRADQDAIRAALPGVRLVEYAGAGHAFHWEQPQRFAAQLASFADSVAGPARSAERAA